MDHVWRLPPNQNLLRRKEAWPVVGESAPLKSDAPWRLRIEGLVNAPQDWPLEDLRARPQTLRKVDIHCVTRWSKLDCAFGGVRLMDLIEEARPQPGALSAHFTARSDYGHDSSLSLADIQRLDPLIALSYEGGDLPLAHGGPIRIVTPGRYFYKSIKWLARIELTAEHKLGYWERGPGYHDGADPWREERYITGAAPPDVIARLIAQRNFNKRDLRSASFEGAALHGLKAGDALLRNTSFNNADLRAADFSGANLTNARMIGANAQGARFIGTCLAGTDLREADLRGADFTGAALFGANFCDEEGQTRGARLTGAIIPMEVREALSDAQRAYLDRAL